MRNTDFVVYAVLLCILTFAPDVTCFDDDDVEELASRISGDVFLPEDEGYEEAIHIRQRKFAEEHEPAIAVMVENTEDVRHSVLFARDHDLGISITSGRHEFNSRNTGDGTLHISFRRMDQVEINEPIRLELADGAARVIRSINLQPGVPFIEMHKVLARHNLLGVSGFCESVSPGGYLAGGGYGATTRMTGYGVDNIIQITMVALDGSVVIVGPNSLNIFHPNGRHEEREDHDLFWALRGGLGGTFGIVTNYVYRVYEEPSEILRVTGQISAVGQDDEPVGYSALTTFANWMMQHREDPNIGGALTFWNFKPRMPMPPGLQQIITYDLLYFNDNERGRRVMEPMINLVPDFQLIETDVQELDQLLEFAMTHRGELVLHNFNVHMINRYLQREDLMPAVGGAVPPFAELMMQMEEHEVAMCMVGIFGGIAQQFPVESAAINPAMRTAEAIMKCEISGDPAVQHLKDEFSRKLHALGRGVYPGEADYYIDTVVGLDWRHENWGPLERYERLLEIKEQWDPDEVLSCHHCVGDEVQENEDGDEDGDGEGEREQEEEEEEEEEDDE